MFNAWRSRHDQRALLDIPTTAPSATLLREQALFHVRLAEAVALVRAVRAWLYATVQQSWEVMRTRGEATVAERGEVLLAAAHNVS